MQVGYIRISTVGQNTARQEILMRELGVEKVFIDRMSGKNTDRPELKAMMSFVRFGDTVVVESISRFISSWILTFACKISCCRTVSSMRIL